MANSKVGKTCHCPVNCTWGQMSTQFSIVWISWHCSNHICRINVFKSTSFKSVNFLWLGISLSFLIKFKLLFILVPLLFSPGITILWDFLFQELTNILNEFKFTGSLTLFEASLTAPSCSCLASRAAYPAPSATTITKCFLTFNYW